MKRLFYTIIILCIALLGAAFSVRNGHEVNFNYYIGSVDLPLSLIMVASFAVGIILSLLSVTFGMMKLRLQLSSAKRKYAKLEDNYKSKIKALDVCKLEAKRKQSVESIETLPEVID